MTQQVVLAARRTPIGKFLGGLSRVPSPQLGAYAIQAALSDTSVAADQVDECIMGCVLQAGLGQNPARQAGLKAGLPETLSAQTVNKVCGSGLQSVMLAAQSIKAGDNDVVVAGGFESMSLAPHMDYLRTGIKYGETRLMDHMAHDGLTCPFEGWPMGNAAEHTAAKHGISREEQDRFAAQSHQRAAASLEQCFFKAETTPLDQGQVMDRKNADGVSADEGVRANSTAEGLGKLRPAFDREGTVTAGNASQISDGAAAVVVASSEAAEKMGAKPMARIVDYYTSGVAPKDIFDAPALGVARLLERNGLKHTDVDLYELNEAFAAQALANMKELGLDEANVNICGGAIALGHPIGASGARVFTTLLHQMVRTDAKRGVASLCLGGGNSVSVLVERG